MNTPPAHILTSPDQATQTRVVYRFSLLILVIVGLATPYAYWVASQTNEWQQYIRATIVAAMAIGGGIALWLTRRQRPDQALWVILLILYAGGLLSVLLQSGRGLVSAISLMSTATFLSTQLSNRNQTQRAIILAVITAVSMTLLEYFWPLPRSEASTTIVARAVSAIFILLFGLMVYRQFNQYLLQTKLIVAFLLVSTIPLTIISSITSYISRQSLLNARNEALLAGATQTANSIDTFINNTLNNVASEATFSIFANYLALPSNARTASPEEALARRLLQQLSYRDSIYISSYALLNMNGIHLLDTYAQGEGSSSFSRDFYRIPLTTERPYVSPIELAPEQRNSRVIYFSAPIRGTEGQLLGFLRVRYQAAIIERIINQNVGLLGEGSAPILIDDYQIRLADGITPDLASRSLVPLDPEQVAILQAAYRLPVRNPETLATNLPDLSQGVMQADKTPFFAAKAHPDANSLDSVAVAALHTQPWQIIFTQPQEAFLQPIQAQTRIAILVTLLVGLVVGVIAVWVSQRLTRPMTELTAVATRITQGDLTAQARVITQDEMGTLASAFNSMTIRLNNLIDSLEQRVTERTQALSLSTEVGRRLSTILDEQELVRQVVAQVRNAFNYYHAHIYLYDTTQENLLLVAGTGEAGQQMLANDHKIAKGQGLVGRAAITNTTLLVANVQQAENWLPNPLLPDTQAEVAVPIALGSEVLGVLDVQHHIVNGLQMSDAELLQLIANQVAIALRNARLYATTQQLAQREALINAINQQILSTTDISTALQVAIREVGRATGAERVQIRLQTNGRIPSPPAAPATPAAPTENEATNEA